jgi:hypothetical protein
MFKKMHPAGDQLSHNEGQKGQQRSAVRTELTKAKIGFLILANAPEICENKYTDLLSLPFVTFRCVLGHALLRHL